MNNMYTSFINYKKNNLLFKKTEVILKTLSKEIDPYDIDTRDISANITQNSTDIQRKLKDIRNASIDTPDSIVVMLKKVELGDLMHEKAQDKTKISMVIETQTEKASIAFIPQTETVTRPMDTSKGKEKDIEKHDNSESDSTMPSINIEKEASNASSASNILSSQNVNNFTTKNSFEDISFKLLKIKLATQVGLESLDNNLRNHTINLERTITATERINAIMNRLEIYLRSLNNPGRLAILVGGGVTFGAIAYYLIRYRELPLSGLIQGVLGHTTNAGHATNVPIPNVEIHLTLPTLPNIPTHLPIPNLNNINDYLPISTIALIGGILFILKYIKK